MADQPASAGTGKWRHLAGLGAVAVFAVSALKVVVVSQGQPEAATALIQGSSPATIIFSTVAGLLPVSLISATGAAGAFWPLADARRWGWLWRVPLAAFGVFLFPASLWAWGAGVAAFVVLAIVWSPLTPWIERGQHRSQQIFRGFLVTLGLAAVLNGTLGGPAWMPSESVSLRGRRTPVTAYVVRQAEGWTTLFRDHTSNVMLVRTSEIENRAICSLGREHPTIVFQYFVTPTEQDRYPMCPRR